MTTTERSIAAAREHLAEARRWCRTQPEAAKAGMADALATLTEQPLCNILRFSALARNLRIARKYILAAPAVSEGYIDGALFELELVGGSLRGAREAEGRDAELAEAFTMKGEGTDG